MTERLHNVSYLSFMNVFDVLAKRLIRLFHGLLFRKSYKEGKRTRVLFYKLEI